MTCHLSCVINEFPSFHLHYHPIDDSMNLEENSDYTIVAEQRTILATRNETQAFYFHRIHFSNNKLGIEGA